MWSFWAEYNFTLYENLVFKANKHSTLPDQFHLINLLKNHSDANRKKEKKNQLKSCE